MTDLSDIESDIGKEIAILSAPAESPSGVDTSRRSSLSEDQIRIANGSWRTPLATVQGWLHLGEELDESSPSNFDQSLATVLGLPESRENLFSKLQERLDRAVAFRAEFLEDLEHESEGVVTHETASAAWRRRWADLDEYEEAEASGPIRAKADVWAISEFRGKAEDGELELSPSYQRADVWPTSDAQQLIESILRGIPLPSIILLEQAYESGSRYEIVDGKQRLTSILRFIGYHPKAVAIVKKKAEEWDVPDALDKFQNDYLGFKKIWRKHENTNLTARVEKELHFPFPLRNQAAGMSGDLEQLRGKYYSEVRDLVVDVVGSKKKVKAIFESGAIEYRVPVITYHEATHQQVHEVFSLYNKQGKHLNAEELRNAAFHELDIMRALLATSGDADNYEKVAPFLGPRWDDLRTTGENLRDYGFIEAGYKRTKSLSWMAATLLNEKPTESRSTANHINDFLNQIHDNPSHPLRDERRVLDLMTVLDNAVDAHAAVDHEVWASKFKNEQGRGKWQELQLVAGLIALAAASTVLHDDLVGHVVDHSDEINERSRNWRRPEKTQSRQQWAFVGAVVRDFLDLLQVDVHVADNAVKQQFGSSGLVDLVHGASEHE